MRRTALWQFHPARARPSEVLIQDLVEQQLRQSVAVLTAVLNDAGIHASVVAAAAIVGAMQSGRKLMVCGNGGSAADAQHLAAEFVVRLSVNRPALRAMALTTDSSILTAIGNDISYDDVFARQVEALGVEGDVLLAISTSGNSKNCVRALELARRMGIHTVGYAGNGGGAMKALCEINVIVPSTITMHIQESHIVLEHILCMVVERCCFGPDLGASGAGPAASAEG